MSERICNFFVPKSIVDRIIVHQIRIVSDIIAVILLGTSVRSAEPVPEKDVILSKILPTDPISSEILYHRVRTAIATIYDEDYRLLCETIYDKNEELLLTAPASILHHHNNGDRSQLRCFETRLLQLLDYADCCASSAGENAT